MNSFQWKGTNATLFFIMHGLLKLKFYCFQLDQIGGSNPHVLLRVRRPFKRWNQDEYRLDQKWNRLETLRLCVLSLPCEPGKIPIFLWLFPQSVRPGAPS